jgi:hypothetical protein
LRRHGHLLQFLAQRGEREGGQDYVAISKDEFFGVRSAESQALPTDEVCARCRVFDLEPPAPVGHGAFHKGRVLGRMQRYGGVFLNFTGCVGYDTGDFLCGRTCDKEQKKCGG